jgi:DNA-binding protein HU-beta
VDIIHKDTSLSKTDVNTVLDCLLTAIRYEVIDKGNEVRIRDFGTFKPRDSAARTARNPLNGEMVEVPARRSLVFSAAAKLRVDRE